jgi:hypothetical protein
MRCMPVINVQNLINLSGTKTLRLNFFYLQLQTSNTGLVFTPDASGRRTNKKILEQVKELMAFGNFAAVVARDRETAKSSLHDMMDEMRGCDTAVIHAGADGLQFDGSRSDEPRLGSDVLIEIGPRWLYSDAISSCWSKKASRCRQALEALASAVTTAKNWTCRPR